MIVKYQNGPTGQLAGFDQQPEVGCRPQRHDPGAHYSQPVSNVLAQMQQLPILPQHVWSSLATGNGKKITTFQNGAPMVSGGPFELTQYKKDQLALFDRNPHWWGATKPKITGFGLQFFANADAMVTALKTGQIDMIGESTPATAVADPEEGGHGRATRPASASTT